MADKKPDVLADLDGIPDTPPEMYYVKQCLRALQERLAKIEAQDREEEEDAVGESLAALEARVGVLERAPAPVIPEVEAALTVPMCRVYNSASISIANATPTLLTFNSEDFDVGDMHSTSVNTGRITIPTAGKYLIGATICWAPSVYTFLEARLIKNGVVDPFMDIDSAENGSGAGHSRRHLSTVLDCAAGDYFEIQVYQVTGGNLNVDFHADYSPRFWAFMVAPLRPAA